VVAVAASTFFSSLLELSLDPGVVGDLDADPPEGVGLESTFCCVVALVVGMVVFFFFVVEVVVVVVVVGHLFDSLHSSVSSYPSACSHA